MAKQSRKSSRREARMAKSLGALPNVLDIPTEFTSPESTAMVGASYNPESGRLMVTFRKPTKTAPLGEETRGFDRVPIHLWIEFQEAASKGAYFNKHIRPLYSGAIV